MGKWFPMVYDVAMNPLEFIKLKRVRKLLVSQATGRVLEIGSGTGFNFPFYTNARQVDAIEPNPTMRNISMKRKVPTPIHTYLLGAEKLPFADNTFDSVVATLVFCTIPDPLQAIKELERVSKPGAKILVLEHVRLNNPLVGKAQDIVSPMWKKLCDGCHLNRNTVELVEQSNLSIVNRSTFYRGLFVQLECVNEKT